MNAFSAWQFICEELILVWSFSVSTVKIQYNESNKQYMSLVVNISAFYTFHGWPNFNTKGLL